MPCLDSDYCIPATRVRLDTKSSLRHIFTLTVVKLCSQVEEVKQGKWDCLIQTVN